MNQEPQDPQDPAGRRRLSGPDKPPRTEWSTEGRRDGLRRVRHMSNWTAAGLIAATAVTTGYLARGSVTTATPPTASTAARASAASGASAAAPGTHKSCITVPVATSGGSGVTRQAPVTKCSSAAAGSGPTVVYVTRPSNGGDN